MIYTCYECGKVKDATALPHGWGDMGRPEEPQDPTNVLCKPCLTQYIACLKEQQEDIGYGGLTGCRDYQCERC